MLAFFISFIMLCSSTYFPQTMRDRDDGEAGALADDVSSKGPEAYRGGTDADHHHKSC